MADGAARVGSVAEAPLWRRLDAERPNRSARRVATYAQLAAAGLLLGVLARTAQHFPSQSLLALYLAIYAFFATAILFRLFAAAAALAHAEAAPPVAIATPTYTILCPLYREAAIVPDLAAALSRLNYPRDALDIKFVVETEDKETIAALEMQRDLLPPFEIVMAREEGPRTKPKALNFALEMARGEFATVYDAEDRPDPDQLRAAVAAFATGDARLACVQAPLLADNAKASWISAQFAAEYAIQFRQILPLLGQLNLPLPLGGTSNHFRIVALKDVHGWDSYNVTEDADLGYRLARKGWRVGLIDHPTMEEAPITLDAWTTQRTRWLKGHMQTWLVLMRNPGRTISEMGLRGFLSMQLVLAGGLLASLVHGPLAAALLVSALTPLDLLKQQDIALALAGYAVSFYGALVAAARLRQWRILGAALTMPLYWPLATLATLRAVFELLTKPHFWAKTTHGVSRRESLSATARPSSSPPTSSAPTSGSISRIGTHRA